MNGLIAQLGTVTDPVTPALGWLAGASLKAALILGVAFGVTLAMRRASAAARHLVWSAAIAAALLLPFAGAVLPTWRVPVPGVLAADDDVSVATPSVRSVADARSTTGVGSALPRSGASHAAVASSASNDGSVADRAAGSTTLAATAAATGGPSAASVDGGVSVSSAGPASSWSWGWMALLLWATGAAVVVAGVLVGLVRVHRLASRARVVSDDRIAARVRELGERLGLRETPRVLRGDEAAMPMTWGIGRSVVFLPAEAEEWSDERLDSVLLHELAHVRRRDYAVQLAADVACAIYWFNPLAWLAARRLRVEREHACDDQVLVAGARPSTYAGELLELARSLRPARATSFAAMSMARPSQLTGRLLAVLDEGRPRRVVSRRLAASIAVGAAALFVPLAALTPAARGDTPGAAVESPGPSDPAPAPLASPDRGVEPPSGERGDPSRPDATSAEPGATNAAENGAAVTPRPTPEPGVAVGDAADPLGARAGAGAAQCWDRNPRRVGTQRNSSDDVDTIKWTTDGCELEARIEGDVRFRGDLMDIVSIAPGGMFRLEEDDHGERRRVEVRPGPDGRLVYEWFVDGDRRPFDDAARTWFAEALAALLHWTGYAAEDHVRWVLARDGVDGVLEDVEGVRTDFVQRRYLTELLKQADPDAGQLVRIVAQAGIDLDSDFELARLLIQVAESRPFTDDVRQALIEATRTLGSDFERARVLTAALQKGGLTEANFVALLGAVEGIGSDFEQARVLIAVSEDYTLSPRVQREYLRAARDIGSDFEQRRVLDALLAQDGLTSESVAGVLDASRELGSDFELAQLLKRTARLDLGSPEVRRAYLTAAESIDSDFELKRVLLALVEGDDLDDGLLRSVIETAATIDSDFELASLLVAIAGRYRIDGEVRDAFLRAADTIGSGFEHGRVSSALLRQERGETR